jgi:NADH pyrophosphatase NudC (nudix superfamily)
MSYNGYTNYATWRICLEWIDGSEEYFSEMIKGRDTGESIEVVRDYIDEMLASESDEGSNVFSYAQAFLNQVDWFEVVEQIDNWYTENFCSYCGEPKEYNETHCSKECARKEKAEYMEA